MERGKGMWGGAGRGWGKGAPTASKCASAFLSPLYPRVPSPSPVPHQKVTGKVSLRLPFLNSSRYTCLRSPSYIRARGRGWQLPIAFLWSHDYRRLSSQPGLLSSLANQTILTQPFQSEISGRPTFSLRQVTPQHGGRRIGSRLGTITQSIWQLQRRTSPLPTLPKDTLDMLHNSDIYVVFQALIKSKSLSTLGCHTLPRICYP